MLDQQYAIKIENIMRKVFGCEKGGIGGMVSSDYIRKQPIYSIFCALVYIYSEEKQNDIDDFISKYLFYSDWSIDSILNFTSNTKEINGLNYEIGYTNGQECMDQIINDFKGIVDL